MQIVARELLDAEPRNVKFLMNERVIAFLPASQQHRDFKLPGLSYEDDYRGNALAGLITENRVEIRYHRSYSHERVANLWSQVRQSLNLSGQDLTTVLYQNQAL